MIDKVATKNMDQQKKYHAFISYRHADNKEPGRQWATWLHQAIETYEVPDDLVGKKNGRDEKIPARIYPIFRDEEELPANADLGNSIVGALNNTKLLIILCSPRAVESTYVADEIDYFKKLGHSGQVIAAMIDGEPNASWDKGKQAAGFKVEDECFPIPLQFEYDENGNQTEKRAEPIAADFRINNSGVPEQAWTSIEAYSQHLKNTSNLNGNDIQKKIEAYRQQQHLMLLKIIAGILGVPLGELTQRDKEYQLELERRRAKKLRRWLSAVAVLAVLAIGASILAYFKQQQATKAEAIAVVEKESAETNLAEAYAGYGRQELADKQFENALTYFLHANQLNPKAVSYEEEYKALKRSTKKSWSIRSGMRFDSVPYVSSNGQFAIGAQKKKIVLYDLIKNKKIHSYPLPEASRYLAVVSDNGENIIEYNLDAQQFRSINWKTNEINSLDYLKDFNFIQVLPDLNGEMLFVNSIDGSFRVLDAKTKQVVQHVTADEIDKVEKGYLDKIKKDWLNVMESWIFSYHEGIRTLVFKSGLTIKFDLHGKEKGKTKPVILPPFLDRYANDLKLSFDGTLLAAVKYDYCLLNKPDGWLKIAKQIDIWDVNTQKKISDLPLKWPFDIERLYADEACDKDNVDKILTDDLRQDAIAINNQLGGFDVLAVTTKYKVLIAWNGIAQDASATIPVVAYQKKPIVRRELTIAQATKEDVWAIQFRESNEEEDVVKTGYWLHEIATESAATDAVSKAKTRTKTASDIIAMESSFDDRFITTLTSQGNLYHYFSATGEFLKRTDKSIFQRNYVASELCVTEDSHELILASAYKVWRYNWLNEKTLWEVSLNDADTPLFSCENNLEKGEFSLVFLDRSNPWSSDFNHAKPAIAEDDSRIIRISMNGEKLTEPKLTGAAILQYPTLVKYTERFGEMYISQVGGTIAKYDFVNDKILNIWAIEKGDNFSTASSIVIDDNSLIAYAGYTNGRVYRLDAKERVLLAQLPMPVIGMVVKNGKLIIDTGLNPKYQNQNQHMIGLSEEKRKSYSYELNLKTLTLEKVAGYDSNKGKLIKYLSGGAEKAIYFDNGELAHFRPSQLDPVTLKSPDDQKVSFFYLRDFETVSFQRNAEGLLVGKTGVDKKTLVPTKTNSQVLYTVSEDRNWLTVSVSKDIFSHSSYLVNLKNPGEPIPLGESELPIKQRMELMDFSKDEKKLLICNEDKCLVHDLGEAPENIDLDTPYRKLQQPESYFRVRFVNQDILTTTSTGKLQLWRWDNGDYKLLKERKEHFYKGAFYDDKADKIIVVTRSNGLVYSSDLETLESEINFNFNVNSLVEIDLTQGWGLTLGTDIKSINLNAQLVNLKTGIAIAQQEIPISAVPSLYHDKSQGKLYWTTLTGAVVSWAVDKVFKQGIEYSQKDYARKIKESIEVSGISIRGISLENNSLLQKDKSYGDLLGRDFNSYHAWSFVDSGLAKSGEWQQTSEQLFDVSNWQKPLRYSGANLQQTAAKSLKQIDQLEQKISENLSSNIDTTLLVQELEKLAPEHSMVSYTNIVKQASKNPYTAYLAGKKILNNLDKAASGLQLSLRPRLAGMVMTTATQSGKLYEAYEIYKSSPRILVPPPIVQQVFMLLANNGYYAETLEMLRLELQKLQDMKMDKEGSPAYQAYQFLLKYQQMIEPLKQRRLTLPVLPTLCLNDIQLGSVLTLSKWKKGDCMVSLNDEVYYEKSALFLNLQQAATQDVGVAKVWREGQEVKVKVPNSLAGGAWQEVGYDGQYVLKITTVNGESKLKDLAVETFDYLIAVDDDLLTSPAILAHHIASNNTIKTKTLWVFRPTSKIPLDVINREMVGLFKKHPLAYWPGHLFSVELPREQKLGISVEPFQVLSPTAL